MESFLFVCFILYFFNPRLKIGKGKNYCAFSATVLEHLQREQFCSIF